MTCTCRIQKLLPALAVAALVLSAGCRQQITSISGRVIEGEQSSIELLSGPQVELVTKPVVGASASVSRKRGPVEEVVAAVGTDGVGRFDLVILRGGRGGRLWQVDVAKEGYAPASTGWRRLPNKPRLYLRVELAPGPASTGEPPPVSPPSQEPSPGETP